MSAATQVAWIARAQCVGCTLCIEACPFDAIAGIAQKNHSVLPDLCTACALCLPVCPVDCISLRPDPAHAPRDHLYRTRARDRARIRLQRLVTLRDAHARQLQSAHDRFRDADADTRQAAIREAISRAQSRTPAPR